MKVFSFLIILIVSIILSLKSETEACVWKNWFCDWITNRNNDRETTTTPFTSITEDEKMQAIRNISSSINQFSIELHQAMAKKTNGSFLSSPFSAAMVLMMAAYGAHDKNAKEMNSMLHFDTNNNTYKTGIYSLLKMFDAINPIGFKLANKIFVGKNKEIKSEFMSLVSETFKSSIENVDFERSEDTTTKINNWCAEKNYPRITNIIKSDEISPDTEIFLINSVYFSALWKTAFSEADNELLDVIIDKEETIEQPIMKRRKGYHYLDDFDLYSVAFDFKRDSDDNKLMKFIMLLPSFKKNNIDYIERNLQTSMFSDDDNEGNHFIRVPKFRIESTINLEDILNQVGMKTAFQQFANFSGISKKGSGLKMDKVVQKLTLEISELGIEAAIHSEASFANKTVKIDSPLEQLHIFNFIQSFVFFITYDNTILFTGRVIVGDH